jgi:hypothetical protein
MSLFIETNIYILNYLSKLSCLDSWSNNDFSLKKNIAPTLLKVVSAFGIAPHASNTLPFSFMLMYSP